MEILIGLLIFLLAVAIGFFTGGIISRRRGEDRLKTADGEAKGILERSQQEAEKLISMAQRDSREAVAKARAEFERENRARREELSRQERRLLQKEENLEKKLDGLDRREGELKRREKGIERREEKVLLDEKSVQELVNKARAELEKVAGLSSEEAKQQLLESMKEEARREAAKVVKDAEDEARLTADQRAKDIIASAIQRFAGEYTAEKTVTVVDLPNEDMKGRIIGREGRNIRSLEAATGVDLIIDDTPEAVIISAFNPVRREVARLAIERLIADGRIHPARIEEVVEKCSREIEQTIKAAGEQAMFDLNLHGLHPDLVKLVGKLRFRTTQAQNLYQHSLEVAFLTGMMAGEFGQNVKQARRAGLLHDVGKAVDHEMEGSHAVVGAEMAKRYGEQPKIVNAIAAHHYEVEAQSLLAVLVQAANELSLARPGARHEVLETYIKRLEELENAAKQMAQTDKVYAIQAGREIRIVVDNAKISDNEAALLCRDIAKKVESEMVYPGQIRVSVIRETRAVEFAK